MLNVSESMFNLEEQFDIPLSTQWFKSHWKDSLVYGGLYVLFVFGGKYLMQERERFQLRNLLVWWNVFLAVFSIFGTLRTFPELIGVLFTEKDGFYNSVCNGSHCSNKVTSFWFMLYAFSKLVEFGDTAFIVLRKQQLNLLHWYHHFIVVVFVWLTLADCMAASRWYFPINLLIHSFMYSYYALRAQGFRVPKQVAMAITSAQLLQMTIGLIVTSAAMIFKQSGSLCDITNVQGNFALAIYASFQILFANFFYKVYLVPVPSLKKKNVLNEIKKTI